MHVCTHVGVRSHTTIAHECTHIRVHTRAVQRLGFPTPRNPSSNKCQAGHPGEPAAGAAPAWNTLSCAQAGTTSPEPGARATLGGERGEGGYGPRVLRDTWGGSRPSPLGLMAPQEVKVSHILCQHWNSDIRFSMLSLRGRSWRCRRCAKREGVREKQLCGV